ncbi:MAG: MCE family protein, partial [Thiohalomonas sp.]|nr:MCE family protein [Thiohalomonas sp.]
GCESNLRHWIILIFFSMKIKHFHRSWVYYSADLFLHNKHAYMLRTNTDGLDIGSPVVLQGVKIGKVTNIIVGFNKNLDQFEVQVRWPKGIPQADHNELRSSLIDRGLRAKLAMHSLITGKLMLQIGFYPGTQLVLAGLENEIPSLPSSSLNKLMEDVARLWISKKLMSEL